MLPQRSSPSGACRYVLMSSRPEKVLATVETVPANLHILPKPFGLDSLRAMLEAVDVWLRAHPLPPESASEGVLAKAYSTIKMSRERLAESLARKERGTERAAGSEGEAAAGRPDAKGQLREGL